MTSAEHPQHEDVMALLDGELTDANEAGIRAHLDTCLDCRSLAGDLRAVSRQSTTWRVEPVPATLDERVKDAVRASASKEIPHGLRLWRARQWGAPR
jgi:anti-sigma factor RsiW